MSTQRGTQVTVERAVATALAGLGVESVFGLMGDDTAKLAAHLSAEKIRFHCARHENSAVAMARGYAWARRGVGVCLLSRGPGMTNGFTGIVDAARGGEGLLILTGERPPRGVPRGAGPDAKDLDAAVFAAAGIATITPPLPTLALPLLRHAYERAAAGETVIFAVPKQILEAPLDAGPEAVLDAGPEAAPGASQAAHRPRVPRDESVTVAAQVLDRAKRPLIIAGSGAWRAGSAKHLEELAERSGAVLGTTLLAQRMFSGHPYDVGIVGSFSHSAGRRLIEQADLVLAVGASLNRYTTANKTALPAAPVVHIDHDPDSIGRYLHADVGLVGDARLAVEALLRVLPERPEEDKPFHSEENRLLLAGADVMAEVQDASTQQAIDPRILIRGLDDLLPSNRTVVTDVGNAFGFVSPLMRVPSPDHFLISTNFAAIGLGVGTAMGAAIGRGSDLTVLFVGDGSLLMVLGELETIAREDLPLVVVCLNDHAYGAEKHYLDLQGVTSSQTVFPDTDFANLAAEFGIEAVTIRSTNDLAAVAADLAEPTTPLLLDCKIAPTVLAPFLTG